MLTRPIFAGLIATVLACSVHISWAASAPVASTSSNPQELINALTQAQQSVVGIQVLATEGARSTSNLGKLRKGSGIVIDAEGLVLTIGYLLLEADQVQIITADKKTLPARAVAYDLATGFGLVRPIVPMRGVKPVSLGSSEEAKSGQALLALVGAGGGASGDDEADVNLTQLVEQRAFSGYWEYHIDSALFTSPPIGHHSGAGLFNQRGQLIGVGSLFVADVSGQASRLRIPGNMFVPTDLLKPILNELVQTGFSQPSRRPWLGLSSVESNGQLRVIRVNQESPAQAAGLRVGDVVLAIDDDKVASLESFYKKLWQRPEPQSEIRLTVMQGKEIKNITLKSIDRMSTLKKPAGI